MGKLTIQELDNKFKNNEMDYATIYNKIAEQNADELLNGDELHVTVLTSDLDREDLKDCETLKDLELGLADELLLTDTYTLDEVWNMAYNALDSVVDFDSVEELWTLDIFNYDDYIIEAQNSISIVYVLFDDLKYYN